jgi:hypothetical protein
VTRPEPMRGCVVELCGLPGSGKSHAARTLIRELAGRGVTVHAGGRLLAPDVFPLSRVTRKLELTAAEIATRPSTAAGVTLGIARSGQRHRGDVAGRVVQWLGTQRLIHAARNTAGMHVFDEGVVQALWSIGLRGDVSGVLRTLQSREDWATPDLVVHVEAPLEVVHARLAVRPSQHSRVQRQPAPQRWAEIARGQALLADIVAWWTRLHGHARLLRWIDDGAAARNAVAAVAAGLGDHHGRPGAHVS